MGFEPTVSECVSSASEADALIRICEEHALHKHASPQTESRLRAQVPKPFWFTVKGLLEDVNLLGQGLPKAHP
jgi:hypothetical protein